MSEIWKPKHGEAYYFFDSALNIESELYEDDYVWDEGRVAMGNCFKTEAEAKAAAEKVKALLLNLHEPATECSQLVTDCNQLPKLTAEFFNHPDCPDWCKVGEWVYIPASREYMQIKKVEDDLLFDEEGHISYANCKQAQPRPYNEGEMKALVGRRITMRDGSVCLCTAYSKPFKHVIFDNMHWDARELMDSGCTIDGKPCFVLEHLNEKGEWVE